jgi:hypothetical protein
MELKFGTSGSAWLANEKKFKAANSAHVLQNKKGLNEVVIVLKHYFRCAEKVHAWRSAKSPRFGAELSDFAHSLVASALLQSIIVL